MLRLKKNIRLGLWWWMLGHTMLPCAMGLTCQEAMAIFSENTTLQLSREACLLQRDLDYYQRWVQELEMALYNAGVF